MPRRNWLRGTLGLVLAVLLLPILEVGCVRLVRPPLTPQMLLRQAEARFSGQHSQRRLYHWIPLAQMPRDFLKCAFVAEDQRFFQHHGFDWREMQIARQEAARKGKPVRGASTISMQCARSLFLWPGRSWLRKGLEAYYTFWLETLLTKRRILELYANVIEMGDGVYGLEAAAQFHYGLTARQLSHEQCALLAALLPAPRVWDPRHPSPKLAARWARLLRTEPGIPFPL